MEVREAMSEAATAPLGMTILEAAQMMHSRKLNRVFVVDGDGAPLGILTSMDVLSTALCDEYSEVDYGDD